MASTTTFNFSIWNTTTTTTTTTTPDDLLSLWNSWVASWGPPIRDFLKEMDQHVPREQLREKIEWVFYGTVIPYILRAPKDMVSAVVGCLLKKLCGGDILNACLLGRPEPVEVENREDGIELSLQGRRPSVNEEEWWMVDESWNQYRLYSNWDTVRCRLKWPWRLAFNVSVLRVLFWHWLQPALYFLVFYGYSDLLSQAQLVLGTLVAFRELSYFGLTLLFILGQPAVFLYSPSENGCIENFLYVCAPEMFLLLIMYEWGPCRENGVGLPFGAMCCRLPHAISVFGPSIAAAACLRDLLIHSKMYWPLIVGFSMTCLAFVGAILHAIFSLIRYCCRCIRACIRRHCCQRQ